MERMPEWRAARAANAAVLAAPLAPFAGPVGPVRLAGPRCAGCNGCDPGIRGCAHANYKFYAFVRPENLRGGWDRDRIVAEIGAQDVPAMQGSCSEMYRERAFEGTRLVPAAR